MIRAVFLRLSLAAALALLGHASALAQPSTQPRGGSAAQKTQAGKPSAQTDKPAQGGKAAAGQQKGGKPAAAGAKPGGAGASLLGSFGDWSAYAAGQGRDKLCYALSVPKDRQPKDLKRDAAYLFVSFQPGKGVRNEVAVVMGFPTKDGAAAEAVVGNATYALITKDQNAWVKNPTEENQVVATMSKGQNLVVKASGKRGGKLTDRYSLTGFGQALDRARKECS
jgi:hypothetical protein